MSEPEYKGEKPSRMRVEIALLVMGIVFALLSVLFWPKEAGAAEMPVPHDTDVPSLVQTADASADEEGDDGPSFWDQVRDKFTAMSEDEEELLSQRAELEERENALVEREAELERAAADLETDFARLEARLSEFIVNLEQLDQCAGESVDRMTELRQLMVIQPTPTEEAPDS